MSLGRKRKRTWLFYAILFFFFYFFPGTTFWEGKVTWREKAVSFPVRPADNLPHLLQRQLLHQHKHGCNLICEPGKASKASDKELGLNKARKFWLTGEKSVLSRISASLTDEYKLTELQWKPASPFSSSSSFPFSTMILFHSPKSNAQTLLMPSIEKPNNSPPEISSIPVLDCISANFKPL